MSVQTTNLTKKNGTGRLYIGSHAQYHTLQKSANGLFSFFFFQRHKKLYINSPTKYEPILEKKIYSSCGLGEYWLHGTIHIS